MLCKAVLVAVGVLAAVIFTMTAISFGFSLIAEPNDVAVIAGFALIILLGCGWVFLVAGIVRLFKNQFSKGELS